MSDKDLHQQISGPVSGAVMSAVRAELSPMDLEIQFLHDVSVETTYSTLLDQLGILASIPRPIAPEGTFSEGMFVFGNIGGTSGDGTVSGFDRGKLGTANLDTGVVMPDISYRRLILSAAKLRKAAPSLAVTDDILDAITAFSGSPKAYTLSYSSYGDLVATFYPSLRTGPLYILQALVDRYYTAPRLIIVQA